MGYKNRVQLSAHYISRPLQPHVLYTHTHCRAVSTMFTWQAGLTLHCLLLCGHRKVAGNQKCFSARYLINKLLPIKPDFCPGQRKKESKLLTVKLLAGAGRRSPVNGWYSELPPIQSYCGSLGINPSLFFLFLRLQNKDISLVLTAISAKHANQPETGILWQKLNLYKSFGKTTKTNRERNYKCIFNFLTFKTKEFQVK